MTADGVITQGVPTTLVWAVGTSNSYTAHAYRGTVPVVFVPAGATCTASTCSGHGTCSGGLCTSCNPGYTTISFCSQCDTGYDSVGGSCVSVIALTKAEMRGPLVLSPGISLFWKIRSTDIVIQLERSGCGSGSWVSIGPSPNGLMTGAAAYTAEPGAGSGRVRFTLISGYDAASIVDDKANTPKGAVLTVAGGVTAMQVAHSLTASAVISATGDTPLAVAWGPPGAGTLGDHGRTGWVSVIVNFATGTLKLAPVQSSYIIHGVLMFLSWGVLLPGGVVAAKFCRSRPNACWFKTHKRMQYVGLGIMVVGWIVAIIMVRTHLDTLHKQIGFLVILSGLLQPINAIYRGKISKVLGSAGWDVWHKGIGWGGLVAAVYAMATGFMLVDPTGAYMWAYLGISIVASALGMVVWLWRLRERRSPKAIELQLFENSTRNPLRMKRPSAAFVDNPIGRTSAAAGGRGLSTGGKKYTMSEVASHTAKTDAWIVVNGAVYDVTAYMADHPGGLRSILKHAGRDASVAFGGSQHKGSEVRPILTKYRIGELVVEPPTKTMAEVASHTAKTDAWIVVDGAVYDITAYMADHPGGLRSILKHAGRDASAAFAGPQHTMSEVRPILEKYKIADLAAAGSETKPVEPPPPVVQLPSRRVKLEPGHGTDVSVTCWSLFYWRVEWPNSCFEFLRACFMWCGHARAGSRYTACMQDWHTLMGEVARAAGTVAVCESCDDSLEAVARCSQCNANLCTDCRASHMRLKAYKSHVLITVAGARGPTRAFTLADVHAHNLRHDAWTVIRGKVRARASCVLLLRVLSRGACLLRFMTLRGTSHSTPGARMS